MASCKCFLSSILSVFCVILSLCIYAYFTVDTNLHEEFLLTFGTRKFAAKFGYPTEEHYIETEDGYKGVIFRLLPRQGKAGKKAVLIFGGVACSSDLHVLLGPNKDYSFILSDAGFDVWLANTRGTIYFSPNDPMSNHSFHEMGFYDLPAITKYISEFKGGEKIHFIGESMGCTSLLVTLSLRPEYNAYFEQVLCLGFCIADLTVKNVAMYLSHQFVLKLRSYTDGWLHTNFPHRSNVAWNCKHPFLSWLCNKFIYDSIGLGGHNTTLAGLIMSKAPFGPLYGILEHTRQNSQRGEFAQFDYGRDENLKLYGSEISPTYPCEKVTVPIRVYYVENDSFGTYEGILRALDLVPNLNGLVLISAPFRHTNFVINSVGSDFLINDVLNRLN